MFISKVFNSLADGWFCTAASLFPRVSQRGLFHGCRAVLLQHLVLATGIRCPDFMEEKAHVGPCFKMCYIV